MGILDGLSDPVFMAAFAERSALVATLADRLVTTPAVARAWLEDQDQMAMEVFQPGNEVPRETLH